MIPIVCVSYERVSGICSRKWVEIQNLLESCNNLKELRKGLKEADQIIIEISIASEREILKVGLVGEIYLVMDSCANKKYSAHR